MRLNLLGPSRAIKSRGFRLLARSDTGLRLIFLNPNTSAPLTELGLAVARKHARPDTQFVAMTGRFGARYISHACRGGDCGPCRP